MRWLLHGPFSVESHQFLPHPSLDTRCTQRLGLQWGHPRGVSGFMRKTWELLEVKVWDSANLQIFSLNPWEACSACSLLVCRMKKQRSLAMEGTLSSRILYLSEIQSQRLFISLQEETAEKNPAVSSTLELCDRCCLPRY